MIEQENTSDSMNGQPPSKNSSRARLRSLKAHGSTGERPNMDPVDAFNAGICFGCGGHYPTALHLHIPGCPHIDPPVQHWKEFRDRLVPPNETGLIQLRTAAVRARFSESAKRSFDDATSEGKARREILAAINKGKTRIAYWPTITSVVTQNRPMMVT
jgi:hypothetical protein